MIIRFSIIIHEGMKKYWDEVKKNNNTDEIDRGIFMLLPLRYVGDFSRLSFEGNDNHEIESVVFDSYDFTEILSVKCRKGDFVKRFNLKSRIGAVFKDWKSCVSEIGNYSLTDLQLFVFHNGISFLSVYLGYKNKDVDDVYRIVNPGYIENKGINTKEIQDAFINSLEKNVIQYIQKVYNYEFTWFVQDTESKKYLIKEAYRLNVAAIPNRFKNHKIPKRIAYNGHRLVDVTRDFKDSSESDVDYTSGARDVDDEHYGWGCAITSQEISYAYGPGPRKTKPVSAEGLIERAEDDLMLTIFVMYQKYTCVLLNEEIHKRYSGNEKRVFFEKNISDIKKEVLEFIAYGTLATSQISRWNNVCETYAALQKQNGVNEAIVEINEKIVLLNEAQEQIDNKRESRVGTIIAVFGFVSIVAATLQVVDYLSTGRIEMIIGFIFSVFGLTAFGIGLLFMGWRKRKKNGDV